MYMDKENLFCEDLAVTTSAASTNIIDLHNVADRSGNPPPLVGAVDEAFAASGDGTLAIEFQESVDAAFTSPIVVVSTGAIAKTALGAGVDLIDLLPEMPRFTKRWVRLYFTVATGPFTAGKLTLGYAVDSQTNTATAIKEQSDLL